MQQLQLNLQEERQAKLAAEAERDQAKEQAEAAKEEAKAAEDALKVTHERAETGTGQKGENKKKSKSS